jgi:hypothetical protein
LVLAVFDTVTVRVNLTNNVITTTVSRGFLLGSGTRIHTVDDPIGILILVWCVTATDTFLGLERVFGTLVITVGGTVRVRVLIRIITTTDT